MSASFFLRRSCALLFVLALLCAAVCAGAQTTIRSLTGIIEGHQVGGVTIDLIGNIYVADFGDLVWKITPQGERQVFASVFMAPPETPSTMKATSYNRTKGNKMKTTLTVITIMTSLLFSACANN